MAVLPASAAAAYQSIAKIGSDASAASRAAQPAQASFGDFLGDAFKDSMQTMRQGEQMATQQVAGNANIVDVVNAVNAAEITLDTVVAVRDKVVQAYQSIMNMPI